MDEDLTEIQVRFVTKLDASVPDTTFSLPVRLQRYGLSGVVNHLLAQGSILHWHWVAAAFLQASMYRNHPLSVSILFACTQILLVRTIF